jgi:hypothetical protein
MIAFAILVALAALSWLGSLAYAYFTNPIERSRLNKRPAVMTIALLAAVSLAVLLIGINSPYGNLSILIGEQQFRILGLWINRMHYFHGARLFDQTQIVWVHPLAV